MGYTTFPRAPLSTKFVLNPVCACCQRAKEQKNGDARCNDCIAAKCEKVAWGWKKAPRPPADQPTAPRCGWHIRQKRRPRARKAP